MGTRALELFSHPETPPHSVHAIAVAVKRLEGNRLWLRYHVESRLDQLVLPRPAQPIRADGLWQTTCFEAFLRLSDSQAYVEYNAAPSSEWAAYHFEAYRKAMSALPMDVAPEIACDAGESHFALEAKYQLPDLWAGQPLQLGISAVIEEAGGAKSYWALAHPPGKPDFHHGDCFVYQLAAPHRA